MHNCHLYGLSLFFCEHKIEYEKAVIARLKVSDDTRGESLNPFKSVNNYLKFNFESNVQWFQFRYYFYYLVLARDVEKRFRITQLYKIIRKSTFESFSTFIHSRYSKEHTEDTSY